MTKQKARNRTVQFTDKDWDLLGLAVDATDKRSKVQYINDAVIKQVKRDLAHVHKQRKERFIRAATRYKDVFADDGD